MDIKKFLLIIILVLAILIVIILCLLNIINQGENEIRELDINNDTEVEEIQRDENEIMEITSYNRYYSIEDTLYNFFQKINNKEDISEFIDNNASTDNKLVNQEIEYFFINDIKLISNDSIEIYYVKLSINKLFNYDLIVKKDYTTQSFSIFLNNYLEENNINEDNFYKVNVESIESNDKNKNISINLTNEEIAQRYFNSIYKKALVNKDYERMFNWLNEEYATKRFQASFENFVEYIDKNYEELSNLYITSYKVENKGGIVYYVCADQFDNKYTFKEKSTMKFELFLDSYTIELEDDIQVYNGYTDEKKVAYNIYKWVQMLNIRDYSSAYNFLNEDFRNKNFGTEKKFEEYMRNNYSSSYSIKHKNFQQVGNVYSETVILYNLSNDGVTIDEKTKTIDIVMKLKDDMDFEMSFNIE